VLKREGESAVQTLARRLRLTEDQCVPFVRQVHKHLDECLRVIPESDVRREWAISQAVDTFCDAASLAAYLAALAPRKSRRFLMRLPLRSVALLAVVLAVSFAFWPDVRALKAPAALFAQDKPLRKYERGTTPAASPHSPNHPAARMTPAPSAAPEHPLSSDVGQHPRIEAALDSLVEFTIDPQPLKEAIDFIAQRYHIPILLDAKSLEDASIDTSTEVKLPYSGMKLRNMLKLLLEQLPQPLGFEIQDGVLSITTIEKINEHRYVVIYDCRDLIHLRSHYPAADPGMAANEPASSALSVPSGPPEIARQFGGGGAGKAHNKKQPQPEKKSSAASKPPLIRVIQYAGDPDDWKQEEGEGPRITEIGGLLVVNQSAIVQEKIKRILADLRRMRKDGAFAAYDKGPCDQSTTATKGASAKGL
jgi:hypothetical protein